MGRFKARIKYDRDKPLRKEAILVPQNDKDEGQGALSNVEDGDICCVAAALDVWGTCCLFPWLLRTVLNN